MVKAKKKEARIKTNGEKVTYEVFYKKLSLERSEELF